jgi:hypothetical protein
MQFDQLRGKIMMISYQSINKKKHLIYDRIVREFISSVSFDNWSAVVNTLVIHKFYSDVNLLTMMKIV